MGHASWGSTATNASPSLTLPKIAHGKREDLLVQKVTQNAPQKMTTMKMIENQPQ
jgi:hypothetical protein